MAEQINKLLMKNYEIQPTGSKSFLEVNLIKSSNFENERGHGHRRDRHRRCSRS